MGTLNWKSCKQEQPQDGQDCLTICKHGMIQGVYDVADETFHRYYWQDIVWYADQWVPIEEANP